MTVEFSLDSKPGNNVCPMSSDLTVSWVDRQFAWWQDRWFRCVEPWRLVRARRSGYDKHKEALVTFPIATFNRGKILCERTIPSILNQSYPRVEVIVVGDKVVDDTKERIAAIKDPRVRFIDLPRRSRYPESPKERWFVVGTIPMNVGMSLARGSWIYVMGDDDVLYPEAVEKMLRFAAEGDYESVTAAVQYFEDGETKVSGSDEGIRSLGFPVGGSAAWMYRSYLKCFPWNPHSWKKSWNRPCDYDLMVRMRRCGVRMGYLNEVVALTPAVEGTNLYGSRAFVEQARLGLA